MVIGLQRIGILLRPSHSVVHYAPASCFMLADIGCRYSETLQTAEVKKHVWTLTFGLAARLAYAAACVGDIGMLHAGALLSSPLLAPLNVLLQWMATQRDTFRCTRCSPCLYAV